MRHVAQKAYIWDKVQVIQQVGTKVEEKSSITIFRFF
jgi:hypothetical protein